MHKRNKYIKIQQAIVHTQAIPQQSGNPHMPGNKLSRREVLRTLGRWTILLAATAGITKLCTNNQACINQSLCDTCKALSGCALPDAILYRKDLTKRLNRSAKRLDD